MALTTIAFLLCYFGGLGLSLTVHPRWGLYTYLLAFYTHPPARWWGASLPDLRWSMLAAVVTFISIVKLPRQPDRQPWYNHHLTIVGIALYAWMVIQLPWANPGANGNQ